MQYARGKYSKSHLQLSEAKFIYLCASGMYTNGKKHTSGDRGAHGYGLSTFA